MSEPGESLPEYLQRRFGTASTVEVVTEQPGRHTVLPDGQVWVDPPRAEQTQPSGYTPPEVGAPTWPRTYGATIVELDDRLEIEWPSGRGMSWVVPKVIEGWVEQVNDLRADRDRLRAVIAAAYADLMMDDSRSAMSGVDSAIGRLRAAGGQP